MPIFDLQDAKPLDGYKSRRKRTMTPQNAAAALAGTGGAMGGFAAAKINRLTGDFLSGQRAADQDLFGDNVKLRGRARKLALDNPLVRNFLFKVAQNVIGAHGIKMVPKIKNQYGAETAQTELINKRIAEEWHRFTHSTRCSADGKVDLTTMAQMAVTNIAREGENLTKFVYGRQFNDYGIAFQQLDNDQLDDYLMTTTTDGNEIRMGVEVDEYRRPLAYHLWNSHPYDPLPGAAGRERKRVPAEFIVHTARWERPGQTRGYTWLSSVLLQLHQFEKYEEAVIVAARTSAAKFATIESDYPEGYTGFDEDEDGDTTNADGTQLLSGDTGELLRLEMGEHLNFTDPRFPTTTHKEFTQTLLRIISSGMLIQYPLLANDLEGVNFSSIRAGMVDERDMWRILHRWFSGSWYFPLFAGWLKFALLTRLQDITLTPDQMEQVEWMARGFDWVDPQKDADSTILKLGECLSTYERECAAQGLDWVQVAEQRAKEQKKFKELGVMYGVDLTGDQSGKGVAAGDEPADTQQSSAGGDDQGKQGQQGKQNAGAKKK